MNNRARQIMDDIVTLEVNTIINRNIVAKKMPKPRLAMYKIACCYRRYLKTLELNLNATLPEKMYTHSDTFILLAEYAREAAKELKPKPSDTDHYEYDHDLVLLSRIKDNCYDIINLVEQVAPDDAFFTRDEGEREKTLRENLKELKPVPFQTEHLVRLRKICEIGTETIAMQTCVQLDGDVITRINPKYATSGELTNYIQKIHGEGLQISIERWQDIVSTIGAFFKTLVGFK
ncbi:MAG: hypothetical protein OEX07_08940 [Gammaproteobacteria bacterium]|nr:hypothetical protein [Gammaproteobacteria bacterium]